MRRRDFLNLAAAAPLALSCANAATPAALRILAFGDSLTAGFGLPKDEGFVPALSRWVAERQSLPVSFRNAGLSGDTTYGGRIRIGWALRRPADAVMVQLGANDMLLGLSPAAAARNLDAILDAAGKGGRPLLVLAIHAIGNDAYRARWDAIWPELANRHGALLVPDLYATIRAQPKEARAAYLQTDGLHASPRGVATMVALAGPMVLRLIRRADARRSTGKG